MRIRITQLLFTLLATFNLAAYAAADIIVTSRDSTLTANVVWGNGDGPTSFTDTKTENTTVQSVLISGEETGSGESGDIGWVASYKYEVAQDLITTSNVLELGASFSLFSFHGGNGVSSLSADNRTIVEFQNTTSDPFNLTGVLSPVSHMLFEQFDGSQWNTLYDITGTQFDQQVAVGAGTFRISAESNGSVDNFTAGESWSIKVTAVPEPGTLGALALMSAAGYFYRRNSERTKQPVA